MCLYLFGKRWFILLGRGHLHCLHCFGCVRPLDLSFVCSQQSCVTRWLNVAELITGGDLPPWTTAPRWWFEAVSLRHLPGLPVHIPSALPGTPPPHTVLQDISNRVAKPPLPATPKKPLTACGRLPGVTRRATTAQPGPKPAIRKRLLRAAPKKSAPPTPLPEPWAQAAAASHWACPHALWSATPPSPCSRSPQPHLPQRDWHVSAWRTCCARQLLMRCLKWKMMQKIVATQSYAASMWRTSVSTWKNLRFFLTFLTLLEVVVLIVVPATGTTCWRRESACHHRGSLGMALIFACGFSGCTYKWFLNWKC